jgi:sec-independent protein translocase protein TatA
MFGLGAPEILLIFFVILLFFGAKKLPELAQGLGKGIREFKKAMRETTDDIKDSVDNVDASKPGSSTNPYPNDIPKKKDANDLSDKQ